MKIAVIHPGTPAEALPADLTAFDALIAIEGAAADYAAAWWLVVRPETFEQLEPKGDPKLFTTADCLRAILVGPSAGDVDPAGDRVRTFEPLWQQYPSSLGWSLYPGAAAAVLAASLGATAIEIFGVPDAGDRLDDCRACERQVIKGLAEHLAKAGVVLTDHAPQPAPPPPPAPPAPKHKRKTRAR